MRPIVVNMEMLLACDDVGACVRGNVGNAMKRLAEMCINKQNTSSCV